MRAYRLSRVSDCNRIFCCSSGASSSKALSPGMVMVNGIEEYRSNPSSRCRRSKDRVIRWIRVKSLVGLQVEK